MDTRELRELFRNTLPRFTAANSDVDRRRALVEILSDHPSAVPFDPRGLARIDFPALAAMGPHLLIVWISDRNRAISWFAVPEDAATALAAELEQVDGLCFAEPDDCYQGQWRAAVLVAAALGSPEDGLAGTAFNDRYLTGEEDEPKASEVAAVYGTLARYAVKRAADLDQRFVRMVRVNRAM